METKLKKAICLLLSVMLISSAAGAGFNAFAESDPGVLSYEYLSSQYENFVYLATEFYDESDNLLPHNATISRGETLKVKLYYKTDLPMYAKQELYSIFDSSFFDVQVPEEIPETCKSITVASENTFMGNSGSPIDCLSETGYSAEQIEKWSALKFELPYASRNPRVCTVDLTSDDPIAVFTVTAKEDSYNGYACNPKEIYTAYDGSTSVPGKMAIGAYGNSGYVNTADTFISDCDYTFTVAANVDYEIALDETISAEISAGESKLVKFIPEISGHYVFSSAADYYNCGFLYNSDMTLLDEDYNYNFQVQYDLEAGETYYLAVRYYDSDSEGTIAVSLSHVHFDAEDDGVCNICGVQYCCVIHDGETINVEITGGTLTYVKFIPAVTGTYRFFSTSSNDTYAYLYNSNMEQLTSNDDGGSGNNFLITYDLTAGQTYYYGVRYYYSDSSGSYDVTLNHNHTDNDDDFICDICASYMPHPHIDESDDNECDICGVVFRRPITEGVTETVEIPSEDTRELIFNCEISGKYKVVSSYDGEYSYWNLYDSDYSEIETTDGYYLLTGGEAYIILIENSNKALSTRYFTITHGHTDANDDNDCDICGETFCYEISDGSYVSAYIPAGDFVEICFNCDCSGEYNFTISGSYNGFRLSDSDGNGVEWGNNGYLFAEGKTYVFKLTAYDGYVSDITLSLSHVHADKNGDYACDICNLTYRYAVIENEPVTLEIPYGENREVVFACGRTGQYRFNVSSTHGYSGNYIYTSSGSGVGYIGDNLTLTSGETYILKLSYTGSYEFTEVTVSLKHTHVDADGDYACDICNQTYRYAVTENEPVTLEIPTGENREVFFACGRTGQYRFNCSSTNGYSYDYIYTSSGSEVGYIGDNLTLTSGETYILKLSYNNSYFGFTEVTVSLKHTHVDADGDYACDICNQTFRYDITENEPVTLEIPYGENREVVFACGRTGQYRFNCSSTNGYSDDYIYTSSGSGVGYIGDNLALTSGETYILKLSYTDSYESTEVTVSLKHTHVDADGDYACDICNQTYRYAITENEPVTLEIPYGENREVVFACGRTGQYRFNCSSTNGYSGNYIYTSSGSGVGYIGDNLTLTSGETYILKLSYTGSYESTEVTVSLKHTHVDADGDYACDICNLTFRYAITEGETLSLEIPVEENREAVFECEKTGVYKFVTSVVDGYLNDYYVYDSSGNQIGYSDNDLYLTAGETYSLNMRCYSYYSYETVSVNVTVNHSHIDADGDYACDICNQTFRYDITENEPVTLEIPYGENREVVFACGRTGQYRFNVSSTHGYSDDYIYTSSGSGVGYIGDNLTLTSGETYILKLSYSSSYYEFTEVTVSLKHTHVDADGDYACDICNQTYRYAVTENEPVTLEIPYGENREVVFACGKTGQYRFNCSSTNGYSGNYIYTSSGSGVGYIGNNLTLTSGETYILKLSYTDSYESTEVTVSLKHTHVDADGDYACDICNQTYRYAITENEPVTLEIPYGENREVVFACGRTGQYRFNCSSTHGYSGDYIYTSSGRSVGYIGNNLTLTSGETYILKLSYNNSYFGFTEVTVSLKHTHVDADGDYACDICNQTFRYDITENEPVTLEIPYGENRELVFVCQRTGRYMFSYWGNTSLEGIYNSEGRSVSYNNNEVELLSGKTYVFRFRGYSDEEMAFILNHSHVDADGDYACDICNQTFRYAVTENEPVTLEIPYGENREVVFACGKTGQYRFNCSSTHGYSGNYIYTSSGSRVGYIGDNLTLTSGETYILKLSYSSSSYESTEVTVSLKHTHVDTDGDYACDICNLTFRYAITEGETLSLEIPVEENREAVFECEKTGVYKFVTSVVDGYLNDYYVYDSSGNQIGYSDNNLYLTAGETYSLSMRCYSYYSNETVSVNVTVKHTHVDADGDYACDICNQTFRYDITEGESLSLDIPTGENREVLFTCERTGEYTAGVSSTHGISSSFFYDINGNSADYGNNGYQLIEGNKYILHLSYNNSSYYSTTASVIVNHVHIDSDGDNACDICDSVYRYTIVEGDTVTINVPAGEQVEISFECERSNQYLFKYSGNSISFSGIRTSDGTYVDYGHSNSVYGAELTEGKTYVFRFGNASVEPTALKMTLSHNHVDKDGDFACDICNMTYRYAIAEDESLTVEIPSGEIREVVFECEKTGQYKFTGSYTHGLSDNYIYTSSGTGVGSIGNNLNLTSGETYILNLIYTGSYESTEVTVSLKHTHVDADGDNACDICGNEFAVIISEGQTITVDVSPQEIIYVRFAPERTGTYNFFSKSQSDTYAYLFDSNMEQLTSDDDGGSGNNFLITYDLIAGQIYYYAVKFYNSSSSGSFAVSLTHAHIDSDGDNTCDICNQTFKYTISEDETLPIDVPAGETAEVLFACERSGLYVFSVQPANDYFYVYDILDNSQVGSMNNRVYLVSGKTYCLRLINSSDNEETITVKLKHIHADGDNDSKCDICGKVITFTVEEDEELIADVSGYDVIKVYFTPDRNASFRVETSNCSVNEICNQGGQQVSSSTGFDGNTQYSLKAGTKYSITIRNSSFDDRECRVTVTHAHFGETQIVVAPSAAAPGIKSITCSKCGETVYATEKRSGSKLKEVVADDYYYTIYQDNLGNKEISIMIYFGDDTEVVIPNSIDGIPVTAIQGADMCGIGIASSEITSVSVPDSVQYIGGGAFAFLTGLTEITIPDSVVIIDDMSFAGCCNLKTVSIGHGLRFIGDNAFMLNITEELQEDISEQEIEAELAEMEQYAEQMEVYCEQLNEEYMEECEYIEEYYSRNIFTYVSERAGVEITTWDELFAYAENTDESEIVAKFSMSKDSFISAISESKEEYDRNKAALDEEFESESMQYRVMSRFYRNIGPAYRVMFATEESPLDTVIYAGSESEWDAITICDYNDNLTDASITYNGQIPSDMFTLTYDANEGSGAPNPRTGSGSITVSSVIPVREGFTFLGWSESSTAVEAEYVGGDVIALNSNITLYAVWAENEEPPVETLKGDVNGDGEVDSGDAILVSRYDVGLIELTDAQFEAGDVNGDGEVDSGDAILISRYDAGLIDEF